MNYENEINFNFDGNFNFKEKKQKFDYPLFEYKEKFRNVYLNMVLNLI